MGRRNQLIACTSPCDNMPLCLQVLRRRCYPRQRRPRRLQWDADAMMISILSGCGRRAFLSEVEVGASSLGSSSSWQAMARVGSPYAAWLRLVQAILPVAERHFAKTGDRAAPDAACECLRAERLRLLSLRREVRGAWTDRGAPAARWTDRLREEVAAWRAQHQI